MGDRPAYRKIVIVETVLAILLFLISAVLVQVTPPGDERMLAMLPGCIGLMLTIAAALTFTFGAVW